MRVAYEVTGNITFMDRLERLAFNSLPAALWPDVTGNVYHHCSNQIEAPSAPYSYGLYFCCSANVHQGWPKFLISASQISTKTGKVVVSGYAPSTTILPQGKGGTLSITGQYPFSDMVNITVSEDASLSLRIPCWTESASVEVAGTTHTAPSCSFYDVSVLAGESLNLVFKNDIKTYKWQKSSLDGQSMIQGGGMEIHRGALTYALRPANDVNATQIPHAVPGFMNRAVKATGPWNYGILESSLQFKDGGAIPKVPFSDVASPPVKILAKVHVYVMY